MAENKDLSILKQYIDDSNVNLHKLVNENLTEDERMTLIYELYANLLDLQEANKELLRTFRQRFHIRQMDVKRWMDDVEVKPVSVKKKTAKKVKRVETDSDEEVKEEIKTTKVETNDEPIIKIEEQQQETTNENEKNIESDSSSNSDSDSDSD